MNVYFDLMATSLGKLTIVKHKTWDFKYLKLSNEQKWTKAKKCLSAFRESNDLTIIFKFINIDEWLSNRGKWASSGPLSSAIIGCIHCWLILWFRVSLAIILLNLHHFGWKVKYFMYEV